jgi:hypothetical protein
MEQLVENIAAQSGYSLKVTDGVDLLLCHYIAYLANNTQA